MYDETNDSFIWLFETFLEAMSKKAPKTIFTDQDAAMAKAISSVMPDTYHRLCTWNIMQNAFKKVNQLFRSLDRVNKVLSKFIYYYDKEDEFLAAWDKMLTEYNLHENDRFKKTFEHFERVLNDKRYKELEVEYALCQKIPQVQRLINMLIEAGKVYTKIIFEEFQDEFMSALEFYMKSTVDDEEDIVYTIVDVDTSKEFRVIRKKINNSLSCSYRLFEMNGVLCGHAIKILREVLNLKELPSEYILKRWTRKSRSESVKDMDGRDIQVDARLQQTAWYRNLCYIFTKISFRGAESQETYKVTVERANELNNIIEEMLST
ncbi:hypothetical protein Ddye_026277 [Dipteronia dyeriana]|uniref:Protein FAR1-RELATED SEQUENCE n=1 Tax=Dipteronia dyeriana TaxID=168575 RepID=A0AAD9TLY0_9ROSI|nr:hypothetical protein Ddye_026277 [Dipteronia dyeriana]